MSDIFLSYASEDRERVKPLAEALMREGLSLFWDRIIPVGKTWNRVLEEELEAARSLLVVWSQNSIKSKWVREEADEGLRKELPVFPVLLDAVMPPLGFRFIHAADFSKWDGSQSSPLFQSLARDIKNILGPPTPPEPEHLEPEGDWGEPDAGEEKRLNNKLTKVKAHLWVETEPTDAKVIFLNPLGKFIQGIKLEPGKYQVEVSATGYETKREWVELEAGEARHISVSLSTVIPPPPPHPWLRPLVGFLVVLGVALLWLWPEPPSADDYNRQGFSHYRQEQYDLAIAAYSKAIELTPNYAMAYNNRGICYDKKGQYDLAIADYSKAIQLNPNDANAYTSRGICYDKKKQYDLAIADYTKAIKLNPKNAIPYNNRGISYGKKGQYDLAITDYNKAIKLDPKDAMAYNNRGVAYKNKEQYGLAIADYSKAIELTQNFAIAYNNRGGAYEKKGQYGLAIADYSKVIELNPKSADAYNYRGFAFLLIGKYDEAEKDIQKALELNPDHKDAIISMAELYSVTRKTEDACKWLKKGIEKGYNDWNYIKTFKTFDNIRNSPCYQEIMKER